MEAIIVALITGGLSLVGSVISSMHSRSALANTLTTAQAVTNTKLETLTEEVKRHNNFATRVPLIEEQIKGINSNIEHIDKRVFNLEHAD